MAKKNNQPALPRIPLSDLSERYLHHMETEGKSRGTVFSYSMELGAAQKELGAETPIAEITRADVIRFNESSRVTLLRSGKPKSQLSIDTSRRVLRLALGFAVQTGLLASSPAENYEAKRATEPAINYSLAARIGTAIQPLTEPLGFNWQINVALIPGMAAREVAVGSLGTIYAISGGEEATDKIAQALSSQWSLATALAFLAWYVFAPQCASTLAVIRRETGGWRWLWVTFFYMLALAYVAAFLTYRIAVAFGGG